MVTCLGIAFAYWRIASGISTVGDFMGFITALLMASQPIRALGSLSGRINEGLAAAESFYELVDEKPLIVDRPGAKPLALTNAAIRFDNVGFAYDGTGVQAISGFSLDVPGGQTVALVGRSGAGKSTVLNLVPRLFDVDTGRITIDGQDIRDVTQNSLRMAMRAAGPRLTTTRSSPGTLEHDSQPAQRERGRDRELCKLCPPKTREFIRVLTSPRESLRLWSSLMMI